MGKFTEQKLLDGEDNNSRKTSQFSIDGMTCKCCPGMFTLMFNYLK